MVSKGESRVLAPGGELVQDPGEQADGRVDQRVAEGLGLCGLDLRIGGMMRPEVLGPADPPRRRACRGTARRGDGRP